jgi:hypothetical protein
MPGNCSVVSLGWAFGDHHLRSDGLLSSLVGPRSRDAERSTGPQAGDEFTLQQAAE